MTDAERVALRDQLVTHEGLRLHPYLDSVGKTTIGVGRNLTDNGITKDEAFLLLDHDMDACEADLCAFGWWSGLTPARRTALRDLRFNLGPYRFRGFVKMLDALERQDYRVAALELATSAWAQQVQPSRVDRLVRQLLTGQP